MLAGEFDIRDILFGTGATYVLSHSTETRRIAEGHQQNGLLPITN